MKFDYQKSFLKAYRKLTAKQQAAINIAIRAYENDRSSPALRDHPLKGKMKGLRAFSAGGNLRVIYREENDFLIIILIDTGSHNQVY